MDQFSSFYNSYYIDQAKNNEKNQTGFGLPVSGTNRFLLPQLKRLQYQPVEESESKNIPITIEPARHKKKRKGGVRKRPSHIKKKSRKIKHKSSKVKSQKKIKVKRKRKSISNKSKLIDIFQKHV